MRHESILQSRAMPRAVSPHGLRASTDPKAILETLNKAFEEFKAKHNGRLDDLEAAFNQQALTIAGNLMNGGSVRRDDPEYSAAFTAYARRGEGEEAIRRANAEGRRAQIRAAMSIGSPGDGGYMAPTEWDRLIRQAQIATSPMRQLATVQATAVNAFSTIWNAQNWGSGWVGETDARTATNSPTLASIIFASGEIYANVAVTQRLLDDADIDLEAWLAGEVQTIFNRQEGAAFISGDGSDKPFGLLTYVTGGAAETQHPGGTLDVVPCGSVSAITPDSLLEFQYGLAAPYRQNASWLFNSLTGSALARMKDGLGNLIWRESFAVDTPPTLLGRPVFFDENMPDIAPDSTPIAFGDFRRGYLINDRIGVRLLRDPFTNKPYVMFYVTKRVGAGVLDPRAIRLVSMSVAS